MQILKTVDGADAPDRPMHTRRSLRRNITAAPLMAQCANECHRRDRARGAKCCRTAFKGRAPGSGPSTATERGLVPTGLDGVSQAYVLCRTGRPDGGTGRSGGDADAAARDRLARHVRPRHLPGICSLLDPPFTARAGGLRGRDQAGAQGIRLEIAGQEQADRQAQPWHGDPVLGAELRLLRHDDLDAELSGQPVRL